MLIGSNNLFEVGSCIESLYIGSFNTFEPKCRVPSSITLDDYCVIGAGCSVVPCTQPSAAEWESFDGDPEASASKSGVADTQLSNPFSTFASSEFAIALPLQEHGSLGLSPPHAQLPSGQDNEHEHEHLSSFTVVYGSRNERRIWSGEGKEMQKALFVKHLNYLSEGLPKYSKLKATT